MSYYPDSSFLVSCYILDANTRDAKACLNRIQVPLAFTAFHALEVRNAFKLGVFRGLFTAKDAAAAWSNLEADLQSGRLLKTTIKWPVALRVAAQLSERHTAQVGTRSLDILHIASAKAIRATEFLSFDDRQRRLAQVVGLFVGP
ncbi:MAG: type II toxin-antitoxin system VapC family toxin [Acidobacteriota bacterium]